MNKTGRAAAIACAGFSVVLIAIRVVAGPLDPPSGAVGSTYKTLADVEPRIAINAANTPGDADSVYRIRSSGSYYLTDNVLAPTGKSAIEIAASNVTIDLSGCSVTSISTLASIRLTVSGRTNISIRNGLVGPGGGGGIDIGPLTGTPTVGGSVENVHVTGTSGVGILVGNGVVLTNCTASSNTGSGIKTGTGCTINSCVASDNADQGIYTGVGCVVNACVAQSNSQTGILAGGGSTVSGCVARQNLLNGIVGAGNCLILSNTCWGNGINGQGAGIFTNASRSRIEGNVCSSGRAGIHVVSSDNFIARNTCTTNVINWDIASGNVCLVVQGVQNAGILGDSGGASPGSTNPNANYSY